MYELCEKLEAKGRGGAEGELGRGGDVVGGVGLERMSGGRAGRGNGCGRGGPRAEGGEAKSVYQQDSVLGLSVVVKQRMKAVGRPRKEEASSAADTSTDSSNICCSQHFDSHCVC